jgi:hypothetical protein
VAQRAARLKLLSLRVATAPTHVWPINRLAARIAHGEPFSGVSPASGARVARENAGRGVATVVGRLSPSLRDIWSVRGAERSFLRLIDELAAARTAQPTMDASIAFDPDSLGRELAGIEPAERERAAEAAMLRIARHAREKGVGIELDATTADALGFTAHVGHRIVRELGVPVRLAVSARYRRSEGILDRWAQLARSTGLRLGVRLVKGSYVEAEVPDAINRRADLLQHYREMITRALGHGELLDVGVATHNEEIWQHAHREAARLGGRYSIHVIRGVNEPVQARMRAAGVISREYVSYGMDAPVFGLEEMIGNWRERRAIARRVYRELD